jgi:hypothetical protein
MSVPYQQSPGFEALLLEDSFVTSIVATPRRLDLSLDLVLLPDHECFVRPSMNQHCYVPARISFISITSLSWFGQHNRPAIDATGELDYGGIDALVRSSSGWTLVGDWGQIELKTYQLPTVSILSPIST